MYLNNNYSTKNGVNLSSSAATSSGGGSQTTTSTSATTQSLIKAYFKTPEGRYKLHSEKSRPSNLLPYSYAKTISQVTLAHLKERPNGAAQAGPVPGNFGSSSVRHAAARLLGVGAGNGSVRSYLSGSSSRAGNGSVRSSHFGGIGGGSNGYGGAHSAMGSTSHGGKGSFLVFNVGDSIYICDLNSPDKDPIKVLHFSNSNPVCHAFDPKAKDGHDLLIGLSTGDIYSASLRQQLQDSGKKLVGAVHYNKEGSVTTNRCTSIAWVPKGNGTFIAAHADGNIYEYEKGKDSTVDTSFPVIKDPTQFSVYHARSSKSNPITRWHICEASINSIVYSPDGTYLATVGRDGYLRVFDYSKEQLVGGGKSYYGALLCCAWSPDRKYVLTGGEDDLVTVWSMEDRKVVAWGEGHNSWVSSVAFDSHWSSPTSDSTEENLVYRFGSVGQDTKLLLWDLSMDEIVVPLRRCSVGGSPTFSTGSQSSHWDTSNQVGTLQPSPSMRDVPKLSPLVAHCVHTEPLSSLAFTQEAIVSASWEGHVKIWMRPGEPESKSNNSEALPGVNTKEQLPPTGKGNSESSRGYPLPESKSNNTPTLQSASSKEQQTSSGKGGGFSYKDFSKSNRYLP